MTSLLRAVDGGVPELNYLSREWVDPVISGILHLFGQGESVLLYVVLQHALSLVGLFLLFRARSMTRSESCWGAVGIQAAVTFVGGFNPILYKMQWYPFLLAWAFKRRAERVEGKNLGSSPRQIIETAALFAAWMFSSGGLCIVGLLPLFVIVPSFIPLLLMFVAIALWNLPVFPLEGYPPGARLGPITVLDLEAAPLIGPKLSPNPISYAVMRDVLWDCMLRLWMVGALLCAWAWMRGKRPLSLSLFSLFLTLGLCVGAELFFPSFFALTPVRILYRLVPGAALNPLPWMVFPFFLPLFWLKLAANGRELLRLLGGVLLGVAALWQQSQGDAGGGLYPNYVFRAGGQIQSAWGLGVVPPPSQMVRALYSEGAIATAKQQLQLLMPGRDFRWSVTASTKSDQIHLAFDGDEKTGWSTGGSQQGGEWVEIEFETPIDIRQIALATGGWPSDFPRGLLVREQQAGVVLFSQADWSGPLRFTPNLEPYLGAQSEVILPFERSMAVKKLRIEQIGREGFFNWSIAEIRVYTS